jgi:hypothetical protein
VASNFQPNPEIDRPFAGFPRDGNSMAFARQWLCRGSLQQDAIHP